MSAKLKLTVWIAAMMLLLSVITLAFVIWVDETGLVDDPAERLVKTVLDNEKNFEYERGAIDWDEVDFFTRGVYCAFYDESGTLLRGLTVDELKPADVPFSEHDLQSIVVDEDEFFIYDAHLEISGNTMIWLRGIVPANDDSGAAHTVTIMTLMLLPFLLIISIGGGWLIAKGVFAPIEKITRTANSISDGNDLTLRIALKKGPSEMMALSDTFDGMFDRLERSFKAEKQFTSDASHELRTPITVIRASCDRALRKDLTREDFMKTIGVIDEQANHMSSLVNHLLALTRLQQGTERYALAEGDLSELVREACVDYMPEQKRGITLVTDISDGVTAKFNTPLMASLVQNLLQNAYRYGRVSGHIWLSLKTVDGKAVLSVRDDGIGIAPEDQDKIWLRFWQADLSRGENVGNGLGLSLVKEIAELHGGSVSLDSALGKGSTFTVTI